MRFEKIKQTVEKKAMWLLGHIVLGNNECSSNFPSCDTVLFYSQLRFQVFVVVFFKIKNSPILPSWHQHFFPSLLCPALVLI